VLNAGAQRSNNDGTRGGLVKHGVVEYRDGMPLAEFAAEIRHALLTHKVLVTSGVDPTREQRPFWDEVSEAAGDVVAIDERVGGEKTGERWLEIRYDPAVANAYRYSRNAQPLHTDGSYLGNAPDVMFFYCVRQAAAGGATTFIDSQDLIDLVGREDAGLFRALRETPVKFSKAGDEKTRPILGEDAFGPQLTWNYYCMDPNERPEVKDLVERFHSFLEGRIVGEERTMPIRLRPGEAVFFQDERLLHGRNAFSAQEKGDRFMWKTGFKFRR
jgi:alpha-ketoglutarate-dependent taurine dioxygenase